MRIDNIKEKKGRGRPSTNSEPIGLRLPPDLFKALNSWIAEQKENPGRPEAIRHLLAVQLARRLASPPDSPRALLKPKRSGVGLETRTFVGNSGTTYLVFRSGSGSFHVLAEVEATEAARDCGAQEGRNMRSAWKALWDAK
jgi:hypothetical protein